MTYGRGKARTGRDRARAWRAGVVEEFTIDDPGPDEVLVRILASGVCHTDLRVKNGHLWHDGFPFLLGHEGAGVVEAVGAGVTKPQVGDHVILAWRAPCGTAASAGRAAASLRGQPERREAHDDAGRRAAQRRCSASAPSARTRVVHAQPGRPDPTELPPAQMSPDRLRRDDRRRRGALRGRRAARHQRGGLRLRRRRRQRDPGRAAGRRDDDHRRRCRPAQAGVGREFGATHTVNASEGDPVARIKELTGGNGVNYSFEAVGRPETLEQALWCRDLAGTCVMIGVPGPGRSSNLPLQHFFDLGGSLRVSWYGDCLPTRDFPLLAEWYRQGQLKLDES